MDTRKTSKLAVMVFVTSILPYLTFVGSLVMGAIFVAVDSDRTLCSRTGISPLELQKLLLGIHVTSLVGMSISAVPGLLSFGALCAILSDRARRKGLPLVFVGLGLTAVAAVGNLFMVRDSPASRMARDARPIRLDLSGELSGSTPWEWNFEIDVQAREGTLERVRGYEFRLIDVDTWGGHFDQDVTDQVLPALKEGEGTATVKLAMHVDHRRFHELAVYAKRRGERASAVSEVISSPMCIDCYVTDREGR